MTTSVDVSQVRAQPAWSGRWRWIGVATLVGMVFLIGVAVFLGERESSLDSLEDAVASGDVTVVHAAGGLGEHARGSSTLQLHWRDGLFRYVAEVRETRPLRQRDAAFGFHERSGDDELPRVRAGVVERLETTYPDLRVEPDSFELRSFTADMLGWRQPGWSAGIGLTLALVVLLLVIAGPQPWRATKWAWFWITFLLPPFGVLAYLVLGGPAGITRQPEPGASRLTGGWAFLLTFIVGSIVATVLANT